MRTLVDASLRGGARFIQLRLKQTPDGEALELARWANERCRAVGACLIVNDRFDLADLAGAHGVHLGWDDIAPEEVPSEIRERLLVGLSTHTPAQVRESRDRPIDYIGFGPVFGTKSKESDYTARGIDQLREAVGLARHPVTAIGGIDANNIGEVRRAGAHAAAVISAIANAADPSEATRELCERWA